jgi:PIN domain nuclease of toxin-antitoxin system
MRLLVDTHTYLWWLGDEPRLSSAAREAMAEATAIVHVSAASIWEISLKSSLGRLEIDGDPVSEILNNGFVELPMTAEHAHRAGQLPRHHDDPFDRMLIAQAQLEHLVLISRDAKLAAYGVSMIPA